MVTKRQVWIGLVGVVVTFVTIQCYLYYKAPRLHPIEKARQQSSAYMMIKDFLDHCDEMTVHCILVDTWIMKELVDETWEHARKNFSPCKYLCRNHLYSFAIRESDFQPFKTAVLPRLKKLGYDIQVTGQTLNNLPTHIHLRYHENHAIHIVVLHKRKNWWWYGPDAEDEYNLDFTKTEGALDEFDYDYRVPLDGIELYMPHYPSRFLEMYENSFFMPCNRTRTNLFYDQYPKDNRDNATAYRKNAAKAVSLIRSRLTAYNIPFWLNNGTLLGWYQQCDNIPFSIDVDVGVYVKDHTDDLLSRLRVSQLMLEERLGSVNDSLQYVFDMGQFRLVISFFYEDKTSNKLWYGRTDYKTGEKYKYMFEKFTLCWSTIDGIKVRVPCDTYKYLRAFYGNNPLTPIKSMDWRTGPLNVLPNGQWRDDELDDVIQLWNKKGKRLNRDLTEVKTKAEL